MSLSVACDLKPGLAVLSLAAPVSRFDRISIGFARVCPAKAAQGVLKQTRYATLGSSSQNRCIH
jgi:hypothetical protein